MGFKKLRVLTGFKEEENIKLPMYRSIPVQTDFIKVYNIMEIMMARLNKPELLLAFYLFTNTKEDGLVYNNREVKKNFLEHIKKNSKGELEYKLNTIDHAFSRLKKEGIIVACDNIPTAYWINPAFMFVGQGDVREKLLRNIDLQEFKKELELQKLQREKEKIIEM